MLLLALWVPWLVAAAHGQLLGKVKGPWRGYASEAASAVYDSFNCGAGASVFTKV